MLVEFVSLYIISVYNYNDVIKYNDTAMKCQYKRKEEELQKLDLKIPLFYCTNHSLQDGGRAAMILKQRQIKLLSFGKTTMHMWSIKINVGITEEVIFFFQRQAFY